MRRIAPRLCARFSVLFAAIGIVADLPAVTLGQVDDFQDGTTQNWAIGSNPDPPPLVVMGGGRDGAGDNFLQYSAAGVANSPAGKLTIFNRVPGQWSGDFLGEGITLIQMDVLNLGNDPLHLRLGFNNLFGSAGTWFVSEEAVFVGPGPDWVTVDLPIADGDLTSVSGADDYSAVMSDVRSVRILSSMAPDFRGDLTVNTIGLDDIRALPEPSTAMLIGIAGLALFARRR